MRTITNILYIASIYFMLSCKESSTEYKTESFIKTLWTLESFEISGKINNPPEGQRYNIAFLENGTFSGQSDCNEINGYYTINSEYLLTIDSIVTTEKYCGTESLGDNYFKALRVAKSYELSENKLFIHYGIDSKLNFIVE